MRFDFGIIFVVYWSNGIFCGYPKAMRIRGEPKSDPIHCGGARDGVYRY